MKHAKSIFTVIFLFLSCNSGSESNRSSDIILTDVLEPVLSFGAESDGTNEEFLLARPGSIGVSDKNHIFVIDENKIKIYDENGQPLETVGQKGQGPGEFERARSIQFGYNDFFVVRGGPFADAVHYFTPDNAFIKKIRVIINSPYKSFFENMQLSPARPGRVFPLNETDKVLVLGAGTRGSTGNEIEYFIIHQTSDTISTIARYQGTNFIHSEALRFTMSYPFLGTLLLSILPNNKIVYTHTSHETEFETNTASYKLKILSLQDRNTVEIARKYTPVLIDEPVGDSFSFIAERSPEMAEGVKEFKENIETLFAERKYKTPLQKMLTDGQYIFAFTYSQNEKEDTLVDIFDAKSSLYLRSAYFSVVPDIIKNGYAYTLNRGDKDTLPSVEKFKIATEVYKK